MQKVRRQPVALNLVPRAGDELFALPVATHALTRNGWHVANVIVDVGVSRKQRQEIAAQAERAAAELDAFMLQLQDPLVLPVFPISPSLIPSDNSEVEQVAQKSVHSIHPELLLSPSPHDQDPGAALLGRSAQRAVEVYADKHNKAPTWWIWPADAGIARPSMAWGYGQKEINRLQSAAAKYKNRESDLGGLLNRASRTSRFKAEIFEINDNCQYAELWTELHFCQDREWRMGPQRILDSTQPLSDRATGNSIGDWLRDGIPKQAATASAE